MTDLKTATTGLLVMSESDYPFEIIRWDGQIGAITPEYLRRVSGVLEDSPIEETDVDNFLMMSGQFRSLAGLLKKSLRNLKVYKVGTINIPVYIVGQSDEGNWLGLSTRLIQT
ncbi:MAG: nuclease A inhibitor family protein [Pyrinomonadaceae bacterium]